MLEFGESMEFSSPGSVVPGGEDVLLHTEPNIATAKGGKKACRSSSALPGLALYQPGATSPTHTPWFDVRVIYFRVSSCAVQDEASTPEVLLFRCPPRDIGTAMEVNGARIGPSEAVLLTLRCDRADSEFAEATYVSTDNIRASGTVFFEVFHKEEQLLCGVLQKTDPQSLSARLQDGGGGGDGSPNLAGGGAGTVPQSTRLGWSLQCSCTIGSGGCIFLKGKHDYTATSPLAPHPSMEACIVGRYGAAPVILTQTVALTARRRNVRQVALDAIPEAEESERACGGAGIGAFPGHLLSEEEIEASPRLGCRGERLVAYQDKPPAYTGGFYEPLEGGAYSEGDEGEMSWFNAGVRVGMGLGLGMCLGVGIGVGLLVRTYQNTTRSFRRGLW